MKYKNFLGIDYGEVHCGLAISLNRSVPLGFATISGNSDKLIEKINEIVGENFIEVIVVGIPVSKVYGKEQEDRVVRFKKELGNKIPGVKIETLDETMTSKLAQRYVEKEKEHQEAARIILEDWLEKNGIP